MGGNDTAMPAELQQGWRAAGLWADESLGQAMARAASERPHAELRFHGQEGERVTTLGQLHAEGLKLAGRLHRLGLRPGDVLAMQVPSGIENAIITQAAAALGCTLLQIVHLPDLPALEHRIVLGGEAAEGLLALDSLPDGELPQVAHDPDALAVLLYTSGTTAAPKGVRHSSRSLLAELTAQGLGRTPDDWVLSPWPSGHIAGTLGVLGHALLGRPTILLEAWDPALAARLVDRFKVAQMSGTPFHLSGLMEAAERGGHDLGSFEQFLIGATTVPPALVAASEAAGIRCCRCYGSTEMPTISQCVPDDPLDKRLGTDGRPNPGVEVRIVDDAGQDLPTGAEGEVAARGSERFLGYTDPDLNAASFLPGGWFLTGDIGRIDAEGYLAITDRKKDIIIRGGENISSREVEELMLQVPGVRESAAIGAPDARLGERICAVVTLEDGAEVDVAAIDAAFRRIGVARQKTPELVIVVEEFPRTPSGKIQKAELRRELGASGRLALP